MGDENRRKLGTKETLKLPMRSSNVSQARPLNPCRLIPLRGLVINGFATSSLIWNEFCGTDIQHSLVAPPNITLCKRGSWSFLNCVHALTILTPYGPLLVRSDFDRRFAFSEVRTRITQPFSAAGGIPGKGSSSQKAIFRTVELLRKRHFYGRFL